MTPSGLINYENSEAHCQCLMNFYKAQMDARIKKKNKKHSQMVLSFQSLAFFLFFFSISFCFNFSPPTSQILSMPLGLLITWLTSQLRHQTLLPALHTPVTLNRMHLYTSFHGFSFCRAFALAWKIRPHLTDFYRPLRTHFR